MQSTWWVVGMFLGLGLLTVLPLLFEKNVRESRFLSLTFRLKYLQHLFPEEGEEIGAVMSEWLPNKERWEKFDRAIIGKRVRTIRALTGSHIKHHLDAVSLSGSLVQEIVAMNQLVPSERYASSPLSSGEILKLLIEKIDPTFKVDKDPSLEGRELRHWLKENAIDFEQVVELILAAVEILYSRLPEPAGGVHSGK